MTSFAVFLFAAFVFPIWSSAKSETNEIRFEKRKIKVATKVLTVEIADTEEKTSRGLMFRKQIPEGTGMLFIFKNEQRRGFWMKNTFVPLSIGFFDRNQKLVEFFDMEPVKSEMELNPKTYPTQHPAQFALEVPKGWFQKHKIKIGDRFEFQ